MRLLKRWESFFLMNQKIRNILDFWFVETPSEKRFKKDSKFDNLIKEKFLKDYELAITNKLDDWQESKKGCLALIILVDQFSRNLFRENKKAFEFLSILKKNIDTLYPIKIPDEKNAYTQEEIYNISKELHLITVIKKNLGTINQSLMNKSNKYILITGSLYLIGKIRKNYL